jgi:plastocyanin
MNPGSIPLGSRLPAIISIPVLIPVLAAGIACGDSGGSDPSDAGVTGSGGASAGSGGASGGGTGGGSGNPNFTMVSPCNSEASYAQGTTVDFSNPTLAAYMPSCLKVPLGTLVTFNGNFVTHPLEPSATRGLVAESPITATSSGSSRAFMFRGTGFFAYYCSVHGPSDTGAGMAGVIWVE